MISGTIPPQLGNLGALTELRLDTNRLVGEIPDALGGLVSLRKLHKLTAYRAAFAPILTQDFCSYRETYTVRKYARGAISGRSVCPSRELLTPGVHS